MVERVDPSLPAASEVRNRRRKKHRVAVIPNVAFFYFAPSNLWMVVG